MHQAEIKITTRLGIWAGPFDPLSGFATEKFHPPTTRGDEIPDAIPDPARGESASAHHPSCTARPFWPGPALFEANDRFALCAETDDAPTAREMFVQHQPQLVALGLTLHRGSDIQLIKAFRRLDSAARILASRRVTIHCRSNAPSALGRMDT
jgi:hypothetical protein